MKRKHLYIAAAVVGGALLAWFLRRPKTTAASVSLGDSFAVNWNTYSTPPDLLTPEKSLMIN